ncbi:nucleotidyltransferase [Ralstonia phage DU_RP_I]|uniref:Uncharacterized protein n=1 Tax=Ralstonia phage DU_RP_I TaxID=2041493 RepID=A0A2D2W501_9CAUD|nr:nucleotidyltransferase [Ralstonia phage DU_RP_I]ATS93372.1 hypothetical protein R1B41kb_p011 [Ralstonia phage DU_RP_I]
MIDDTRLQEFREILDVVRWEFPGSHPVIGGGALRDSYHGRPIKDVDVFMRRRDHETLNSELTRFIRPPILVAHGYGRPDMHGAWDLTQSVAGYEVQLILADFENLEDLAGTFDLGIARATFDGDRLFLHPDFLQDSTDKVFRIRRADNLFERERSLKRIKRLAEKYPDFSTPDFEHCPVCAQPIIEFRDAGSVREHQISGLCQQCQYVVFDKD